NALSQPDRPLTNNHAYTREDRPPCGPLRGYLSQIVATLEVHIAHTATVQHGGRAQKFRLSAAFRDRRAWGCRSPKTKPMTKSLSVLREASDRTPVRDHGARR